MELLLNLLWLLVALASSAVWWTRWSRHGGGPSCERQLRSAVGLACVLVLLFFAISLTDDLHAVPALAEDARSARRMLQSSKGGQSDPDPDKQNVLVAEASAPSFLSPAMVMVGRLSPDNSPVSPTLPAPTWRGRAPPLPISPAL